MKSNGNSENYHDQNLKAMIVFVNLLGLGTTFLISLINSGYYKLFLNTKLRNTNISMLTKMDHSVK